MAFCLLGIGANLGNASLALEQAYQRLDEHPRIRRVKTSSSTATAPVGGPAGQPGFLNAAVIIETELEPLALLEATAAIESAAGRHRGPDVPAWSARPLDIDLLLYDEEVVDHPRLQIPHPLMVARRFVLESAAEIGGALVHPLAKQSVLELWQHLQDTPDRFAMLSSTHPTSVAAIAEMADVAVLLAPRDGDVGPASSPVATFEQRLESAQQAANCLLGPVWKTPTVAGERRGCLADFWIEEFRLATPPADQLQEIDDTLFASSARPKLVLIPDHDELPLDVASVAKRATELSIPYVRIRCEKPDDLIRVAAGAITAMKQQITTTQDGTSSADGN